MILNTTTSNMDRIEGSKYSAAVVVESGCGVEQFGREGPQTSFSQLHASSRESVLAGEPNPNNPNTVQDYSEMDELHCQFPDLWSEMFSSTPHEPNDLPDMETDSPFRIHRKMLRRRHVRKQQKQKRRLEMQNCERRATEMTRSGEGCKVPPGNPSQDNRYTGNEPELQLQTPSSMRVINFQNDCCVVLDTLFSRIPLSQASEQNIEMALRYSNNPLRPWKRSRITV